MPAVVKPGLTAQWTPRHNPWVVALTVTIATFMEVLDTSIANVALPHIAGSLGATPEEATWVLTSYLVSAAIVLPISGWLATVIGRKRFYMTCVALFTVCSFLCGIANSLPMLIIARVLQGCGGGGLQPSEQAILADTFHESKRGMAFAVYGMAVVVAPAIGPTLGGWITDNYSWHWIFFINIPVGILSMFLTQRLVEDPPYLKKRKDAGIKIDYIGLTLIVIGVACLQIVLDKGQEDDWFGSDFIIITFAIAAITLLIFIVWEWLHPEPIVDVKLLRNRNFGTAVFFQFILGLALFGTTVLIPLFLQTIMGYSAQRAGMALSPGGFLLMLLMPVAGKLVGKFDPRLMIAFGFGWTAFALHHMSHINLGIDFGTIVTWRLLQVAGLPFIFVPISTLNYVGVPREKNNQISGLSNFARNIGGSVGTSLLATFLARQAQIHLTTLSANTTAGASAFQQMRQGLTANFVRRGFDPVTAGQKALAQIYGLMEQQSSVLGYVNTFAMLSILMILVIPLPFIMRRPRPEEARRPMADH